MPGIPKIRALAASIRLANLPSVWCNTWLGIAIGVLITGGQPHFSAFLALIAASCLYFAGNLLNDWWDRHWDATHRPERALPANLFRPYTYLTAALVLALVGTVAAARISSDCVWVAVAILGCIALYTVSHKATSLSVFPMAICRALLPILGALSVANIVISVSDPASWPIVACAGAIFCHVAGITHTARWEHLPVAVKPRIYRIPLNAMWFFAAAILMSAASLLLPHAKNLPITAASLLPYLTGIFLAFSVRHRSIGSQVSWLLAILPLLDAILLIPLSAHLYLSPAPVAALCILLPPATFVMGRWLQKLAPAS